MVPLKNSVSDSKVVPLSARRASVFLTTLYLPLGAPHLATQLGHLGHLETLEVDNDRAVGTLERLFELLQLVFFERSSDCH